MAIYKDINKTKDGRQWYFKTYKKDFNGINKPYKSKKYLTKKEAQEAEALFLLKRDNPSKKLFITIANDYFNDYEKKRKETSYESYLYAYNLHIMPYFGNLYIDDINIPTIRNWKENIENKGYKLNYLNKIYTVLNNIFNYARVNYGLKENLVSIIGPFEKRKDSVIKDEEKTKYITLSDFNKFISVIDDITWKTFFIFLFYTGCRKGEVLALNWNDIDFDNNVITINKTLNYKHIEGKITSTKNLINRKIKMNLILKNSLEEYQKYMSNYVDFKKSWFVFGGTRFLAPVTIDRAKDKYFNISGVTPITIHEFRHSHVSLLMNEYIKSGQTDTTKFFMMMSNRMGHTIAVMQKTYMHLFPSVQDEIVDLLNNL